LAVGAAYRNAGAQHRHKAKNPKHQTEKFKKPINKRSTSS
jgi:hypothetical protein